MSHKSVRDFIETNLSEKEVQNSNILEVGSYDFNGEIRSIVLKNQPKTFIGIDMLNGPGVDQICDVVNINKTFGKDVFDIVISAETFEHVKGWRQGINNIKRCLKSGGILLLTTRSICMDYHGYPNDYWRYQEEDIEDIFNDFEIVNIERDKTLPGVFVKCRKPVNYIEKDLNHIKLYSMLTRYRISDIKTWHYIYFIANTILRRFKRLVSKKLIPK